MPKLVCKKERKKERVRDAITGFNGTIHKCSGHSEEIVF